MTWFRFLLDYFFPKTMMLPTRRMPQCAAPQMRFSSERCCGLMDTRCIGGNCTAHCREHCGPHADCFDPVLPPDPVLEKQKATLH